MKNWSHPLRALPAVIGVVALALVAIPGALPANATASAYCGREVVHNYLKPLEGLPELRSAPINDKLPFGPSGLFFNQKDTGPFVTSSEEFGFALSFSRRTAVQRPSPRLDWTLTATLARIDRRGKVRNVLHTVTRHVARVGNDSGVDLPLPFQFQPGLYRLEVVFENKGRKRLGRFGRYFRALRRTDPDSRLTLNGASFQPGETVSAEAQEYGVGWISLSDTYSIEVNSGDLWTKSPISPTQVSLLIDRWIGPGEAVSEPCWRFTIPSDAPAGLYRFVIEGASMRLVPQRHGLIPDQPIVLTSEFQILPAIS